MPFKKGHQINKLRHIQDIRLRFFSMIKESSKGCWFWIGTKDQNGYGKMIFDHRSFYAHRLSYVIHKGKIPEGFEIHHTCKNTSCVRPEHLRALTKGEHVLLGNTITAINARKIYCPRGHVYDGSTYMNGKFRQRFCKTCRNQMLKRMRIKKTGALQFQDFP